MKKSLRHSSFWEGEKGRTIIVAHRGGDAAGIEKENSMSAFNVAYEMGYRWFETDVVATKDGKLVVIHGRGYQRKPNKDLPLRTSIQRRTYEDISRKLMIGGERPLLLTELLDSFKDVKFFIDPKTYRTAPVLVKVLSGRPNDLDRVLVGSFLPFNTPRVRRDIRKFTGLEVQTSILGPLRAMPIKLAAVVPPVQPLAGYYVHLTKAESMHIPFKWITGKTGAKVISTARKLGLKVAVYTPNDKVSIKKCLEKGVDVIMSDRLRLLRSLVTP